MSDTLVERPDSTLANVSPYDQNKFSFAAYAEFLTFLSLGCNGSPIHGYPTLIVILSTIPKKARNQFPISILLHPDVLPNSDLEPDLVFPL